MKKPKIQKESPIKQKPLRRAGEIIERINLKFLSRLILFLLLFSLWVGYSIGYLVRGVFGAIWWHNWAGVLFLVAACIILKFFFPRWDKEKSRAKLGEECERIVVDELAKLGRRNEQGQFLWRDFHNLKVPGANGNIDHVLVCPAGIFCLETKGRSQGDTDTLVYDGQRIRYKGGRVMWKSSEILRQASTNAKGVHDFLLEHGENRWVIAMVIFPGWKIERVGEGKVENTIEKGRPKIHYPVVRVCNEEEIHKFEKKGKNLSPEETNKIAGILDKENRDN